MTRKCLAVIASSALVLMFVSVASAQDAKKVIVDATRTMGYAGLKSIEYSGPLSHEGAGLGQWMSPTKGWHANTVKNYTRYIDLAAGTSIRNGLQSRPGDPSGLLPGGAGLDPNAAENQTSPTIAATANFPAKLEITLSPPGFLLLANAAANPTAKKQGKYVVVSFDSDQKAPSGVPYKLTGYIDSKTSMLEKVQTAIEDDATADGGLFGDVVVEQTFSGLKNFNGTTFPTKITQTRAGVLWNDATVESVKTNGPAPAAAPAAGGGGGRGGGAGAAAPAGGAGGRGGGAPAGGGAAAPGGGGGRGGGAGAPAAGGAAPGAGGQGGRGGAGAGAAAPAGGRGGAAPAAEGGAPAAGGRGGGGAAAASFRKIGDGVFVVTSGYRTVAVEMKDGIVVLDAPPGGIEAMIAQVHLAIPNKPITHVITSHMHFDHVAGLRTLLADGAKPITIVTHEMNKDIVEQWFKNPHTLNTMAPAGGVPPVPGAAPAAGGRGGNAAAYAYPDALAKSGKKVKFEYVKGDKMIMKDSMNTIEIYPINGAVHSEDMMVVYLPKAKAVYQADAWNPVAANTLTNGLGQRAFQKLLANELDRLKVDYTIVVSGHAPNDGRDASKQDLMVASGITPPAAGATAGGGQRQ